MRSDIKLIVSICKFYLSDSLDHLSFGILFNFLGVLCRFCAEFTNDDKKNLNNNDIKNECVDDDESRFVFVFFLRIS